MQVPGGPEDTSGSFKYGGWSALMTFPITLGNGKRLFGEGTIPAAFRVTDSLVTPNGAFFANYERAGEVKTGTVGA